MLPGVLGRRVPTKLGIVGSVRPALKLLLERVDAKSDSTFFEEQANGIQALDSSRRDCKSQGGHAFICRPLKRTPPTRPEVIVSLLSQGVEFGLMRVPTAPPEGGCC
jgi:thiamine pyrophosphate-dependent acetolactate synthase large subunit-like protein